MNVLSLSQCLLTFTLPIIILGVLIAMWVSVGIVKVEGTSMLPTLREGDRVLVLRNCPPGWLRKGNIVVVWPFVLPTCTSGGVSRTDHVPYIKRIVGLPGETFTTNINELDTLRQFSKSMFYNSAGERTWYIPPNHVFVHGDNLPRGSDSQSWGPIPIQRVTGVVILKLPRALSKHTTVIGSTDANNDRKAN